MDLIEKYIFAVTQKLPAAQRKDIAEELRGLIEDMLDERTQGKNVEEADIENVLIELGNPKELAQKYRGTNTFLIGPELYDSYITVLKTVMITIAAVIGSIFVIQLVFNPIGILEHFIDLIIHIVTWVPTGFGWTTIIFALAERFTDIKAKDLQIEDKWSPKNLPEIPGKRGRIHRSEAILGIIIYTVFLLFFTFSTDFFGVWLINEDFTETIPFINTEMHTLFIIAILIILGFGVLKESLKLVHGRWNTQLVVFTLTLNIISIIVVIFMITQPNFWNPNFMEELIQHGLLSNGTQAYDIVNTIWIQTTKLIPIFLLVGLVWDVIDGIIKVKKK
ncbi:HAAS signaling domain-containing protein [Oceanobacillus sp. CAU 1775]